MAGAQGRHDAAATSSGLIAAAHDKLGYPGGARVQTAEFSALPHGSIQPQVIREGTIILIDGGCSVEGYESDISRTFVLGKPTDKMKKVFDIEFAAQTAALKAARPGVPCEAVDAAARKVIEDGGYGPGYKYFTHRVGHGMGMDGHEWPYLVKGNTLPLAPGMTFSDEPGIYIPRRVRRAARGRHVHHRERRRADDAAEPIAGDAVRDVVGDTRAGLTSSGRTDVARHSRAANTIGRQCDRRERPVRRCRPRCGSDAVSATARRGTHPSQALGDAWRSPSYAPRNACSSPWGSSTKDTRRTARVLPWQTSGWR